jgi:hypothetical protein
MHGNHPQIARPTPFRAPDACDATGIIKPHKLSTQQDLTCFSQTRTFRPNPDKTGKIVHTRL